MPHHSKGQTYFLIGPYPPPLGGVSVFAVRFEKLLTKSGVRVRVFDLHKGGLRRALPLAIHLLFDPRPLTFYFNTAHGLKLVPLLALRPFPRYVVFHDHGEWEIASQRGGRRIGLFRLLIRLADEIYLAGCHLREYYARLGIDLSTKKVAIRHAFLPPDEADEEHIVRGYPPALLEFMEKHRPLIVVAAAGVRFYEGQDLYGLDMCVDMLRAVCSSHARAGLVVGLAVGDQSGYVAQLKSKAEAFGIDSHIFWLEGDYLLWPVIKRSTVFVRPTNVDSYGVSVAEALHFGVKAVASDVCERPVGTLLFRSRDLRDFVEKVLAAIEDR